MQHSMEEKNILEYTHGITHFFMDVQTLLEDVQIKRKQNKKNQMDQ